MAAPAHQEMIQPALLYRALAARDGHRWRARCLELGVATTGDSLDELQRTLREEILFRIRHAMEIAPQDPSGARRLLSRDVPFVERLEWFGTAYLGFGGTAFTIRVTQEELDDLEDGLDVETHEKASRETGAPTSFDQIARRVGLS